MGDYSVNDISQELAKHLDFSETSTESVKEVQNSVENVTNKMEGIKQSLEHVKADISTRSELASKELYDAAHHLDALYDKIDALERFINIVKQTVNDVTNRVEEAEAFITNPINLVLDTLKINTSKSIEPSDLKLPPMRSLNIYHTSDYFPPEAETSEQL
ncbi:16723_t:CDS:2 [Gigaspora margarita]|uniref:16723_t:CDS:1 n=2 Tax=Gigaspora margarita TaxID=4874 RepID=A0ABN7UH12_GIGMA|nr:biogenesis of lysosome-related organelles complex 1 subunit 4 [Gigaspora margarita]CAG8579478.1 16723_t:CDS:2 [Gigaspora margarita]